MKVTDLFIYPIKSIQAHRLVESLVQPEGLTFDRQFMLTEPDGKFITARKDPELYHFSAYPIPQGLFVRHKDGSQIWVHYADFSQLQQTEVWGSEFPSYVANSMLNQWFSEKMGRTVQLRWLGEQSQRRIKRFPENSVSFADGYPLLLCTETSLNGLQQHCPDPIQMTQFRPNLVIDGITALEEHQWQEIQVGEVRFLNGKSSVRCTLTTRDPASNQLNARMEPYRTLKKVSKDADGQPIFGINLIPLNAGVIKVGDEVRVLSYR